MTRSKFIELLITCGVKPETDRGNLARHIEKHIRSGFITSDDRETIWAAIRATWRSQKICAEASRRGRTIDERIDHLSLATSHMTTFKNQHIGRLLRGGFQSVYRARWMIFEMNYTIVAVARQIDDLRSRKAKAE